MPWATDDYSRQSSEEWCRKSAAEFLSRRQLQFLIFTKQTGEHIGNIGAFDFDWDVPSCEIGYWLGTRHTGQGYMTEAAGVLLRMLQTTLHARRVQIRTDGENTRSRRVAELAGFQLEGVLRNDCVAVGGRLRNTCVFSWIGSALVKFFTSDPDRCCDHRCPNMSSSEPYIWSAIFTTIALASVDQGGLSEISECSRGIDRLPGRLNPLHIHPAGRGRGQIHALGLIPRRAQIGDVIGRHIHPSLCGLEAGRRYA
jgi:ribosomal-protein-serine acetyltransferase